MPRAKKTPAAPGGQAKAQRHDLVMPAQAPAAPTNMAYGAHAESIAAQNAVPLPAAGSPGGSDGGAPQAPGPPAGGGFDAALQAAQGVEPPGQTLGAPTNRPNEPLTHGMPFGPGAGPEALQPPDPRQTTAAILNQLGTGADPQTKKLRAVLNAQLANQGSQ